MAATASGELFRTREGLRQSIETLGWRLESYDNEIRSILREREACERSKKELEEALEAEPSSGEEEVTRQAAAVLAKYQQSRGSRSEDADAEAEEEEESEAEVEEEDTEDEDELDESSARSTRAKGKGREI